MWRGMERNGKRNLMGVEEMSFSFSSAPRFLFQYATSPLKLSAPISMSSPSPPGRDLSSKATGSAAESLRGLGQRPREQPQHQRCPIAPKTGAACLSSVQPSLPPATHSAGQANWGLFTPSEIQIVCRGGGWGTAWTILCWLTAQLPS